jgi:predicted lipoprotein with Yx(FWY)xxD motif
MGTALVAALVLVAGCSSDSSDSSATTTSSVVSQNSVMATSTTTSAPAKAEVNVATNSLGQILTDSTGMTLYLFANDTAGASTCVDACATAWPPLTATTVSVGADLTEANFSLIARPDGTQQLAVGGHPLYRFAGDTKAGETTGQGLNGVWYVAGADGQPLDADAANPTEG